MGSKILSDRAARESLDRIWEVMQLPFDWSADTLDAIADVMSNAGYRQIDEHTMRPYDERFGWWGEFENRYPHTADRLRRDHIPRRPVT